jgi:N-acetylneuraminic acid mutarotase
MKKKSTSPCAFFSLRTLIIFLLCTAACSILTGTLPATASKLPFSRPDALTKASQRTLTFEERVSYQRAIEDVYWRHRIWPKERPDPKPSLDAVMSQAQLEKKVADYLRNSQALEDYWQRPIMAEQLQVEMDRMAKHTKQPEVLRELFEALGNDPFIIAECLARPALAERLLTNWYAYDQRIHGELKRRAEAELQAHFSIEQMKQLSGKYSKIEFVKSDRPREDAHHRSDHRVKLTSREWDETMQKLVAMLSDDHPVAAGVPPAQPTWLAPRKSAIFGTVLPAKDTSIAQIKTGVLSSLQEDEERFYATAVIQKTKDRFKLATVSWPKGPLDAWLARVESQVPKATAASNANYTLPAADESACVDDTWTATDGPPDGRDGHTAVWTGSEMIVWGGFTYCCNVFNSGGRYNPSTDSWTATTIANAPNGRWLHTAVWTGSEMIVWGGDDYGGSYFNTGGRYDPGADSWTITSTSNAPTGRASHVAVWTGNEMIVWGGYDGVTEVNTGARYNPNTDSWTPISTTNAPAARYDHTAVWTGSEMVVWGGVDVSGIGVNTGGKYNAAMNSWTATSTTNAPDSRYHHTAVWTGSAMIIWGGDDGGVSFNTGGGYNPDSNTWTATSTTNAPDGRSYHSAVWTGSEMIVWGGYGGNDFDTGGRYNPNTNSWIATGTTGAPTARDSHTAIWTGAEMVVWGGVGGSYNYSNLGGRYNPITDSWVPTGKTPNRRALHTAVWTGNEMVVWGGFLQNSGGDPYTNTGGTYAPSTDSWVSTSTTNAPTGREFHTAVWSGSEMIVWGGFSYDGDDHFWNTGGRYDPVTNTWVATSTTNTPVGRESQTAVWTGDTMIVWGGYFYDGNDHYLNTGGRYNPITDSWTATTMNNAPAGRDVHTAVWTGSEMVVWGGADSVNYFNTGGRYSAATDSWLATTVMNAPTGRDLHRAVWTGNEMVVWGGYFFDGNDHYLNTGGRYNPDTNTWLPTTIVNVPDARARPSAVWSGNEMIVWGGHADFFSVPYFDTGGRYNPDTDSWAATSIDNAPNGRYRHTAVWTGNEMIIWGGILYSNTYTSTGGRYCAQTGPTPTPSPTPTPTPCVGRCEPTPRPRPTPHVRPTPR